MAKPEVIKDINTDALVKICEDYRDDKMWKTDREHFIFETAMETVFGKKIWTYLCTGE